MDAGPSKRRRISPSRHIAVNDPAQTSTAGSEDETRATAREIRSDQQDTQRESASASLRAPRGLNPTSLRPKITAPRLPASPPEDDSSPSSRARKSRDARRTLSLARQSEDVESDEENAQSPRAERSLIEEEKLAGIVSRPAPARGIARAAFAPNPAQEEKAGSPELPPTRTQLGLEPKPRSPVGILSSSPRPKASARKAALKSSPLKPKDGPRAAEPSSEVDAEKGVSQQAVKGTAEAVEEEEDDPEVTQRRQRLDELSSQLTALRNEVAFLQSQAIGRQRDGTMPQTRVDRLVNLITTVHGTEAPKTSPFKPVTLTNRLASFMPFAKKPKPVPNDPLLQEEILPSYKPVEGSNPLQHLEAFTSFNVSSRSRLAIIEAESAVVHVQDITLSSPFPMDLELTLNMVSDTDTDTIEQLSLREISPWAEAELGTWIRHQADEIADIATIGWGSSHYLDLARTRAKCWAKCVKAFPQYAAPLSTPPSSRSSSENDEIIVEDTEIARHVGKISLKLESSTSRASLTFTWNVDLDWIGDVESRIIASAALPARWIERDAQLNSLGKIPETFDRLVKKVGAFEAIRVIVGVVLGAEGS